MQTKLMIFAILLGLFIACSKDDAPPPKQPDPVQQPDPKPELENKAPKTFNLVSPVEDADREVLRPVLHWKKPLTPMVMQLPTIGMPARKQTSISSNKIQDKEPVIYKQSWKYQ